MKARLVDYAIPKISGCRVYGAVLLGLAAAQTSTWNIAPAHSTAQFTVRHLAISNVSGNFAEVTGSVILNEKDISQSQVSAVIDASSVDTRVPDRDKDLRSPNFLDVEKYPTLEFESKRVGTVGASCSSSAI